MKATTVPNRLNLFVASILDTFAEPQPLENAPSAVHEPITARREREARKDYFYYTQLINNETNEVVGHLSDISTGGFKLDSQHPLPLEKNFQFCMNLTNDVSDKPFIIFTACSKWCKVDPFDPYVYNTGFKLIEISPANLVIISLMMEKHGRDYEKRTANLRNSNRW